MKKLIIILGCVIGVSGCVTPATQMIDNKFLDVELTPPKFTGTWTTAAGGGLSTIRLDSDGKGVMCEDNGRTLNVYQLRNSHGIIYTQSGMSLKTINIDPNLLVVRTTFSAFNATLNFKGDNNLKLASPKCINELVK